MHGFNLFFTLQSWFVWHHSFQVTWSTLFKLGARISVDSSTSWLISQIDVQQSLLLVVSYVFHKSFQTSSVDVFTFFWKRTFYVIFILFINIAFHLWIWVSLSIWFWPLISISLSLFNYNCWKLISTSKWFMVWVLISLSGITIAKLW